MNRYWSDVVRGLTPYVPGEQPKLPNLVKLNTNESPYGPSRRVLDALRAEIGDTLRLYPDPASDRLRAAIAKRYDVTPDHVFVGNGSDEVLAHVFLGLLKHDRPVLFPDITYSFYPVYCSLYDIPFEQVPLNAAFEIAVDDYLRPNGGIIFPNPNAPTGCFMAVHDVERLLRANTASVVVIDEAYVDFGGESVVPLVSRYPQLLVTHTLSKSRALAGLRVGYAIGRPDLIEALEPGQGQFQFLSAGPFGAGGRDRGARRRRLFQGHVRQGHCDQAQAGAGSARAWVSKCCRRRRILCLRGCPGATAATSPRSCVNAASSCGISASRCASRSSCGLPSAPMSNVRVWSRRCAASCRAAEREFVYTLKSTTYLGHPDTMARQAQVTRDTQETQIVVKINLDGSGKAKLASGVPFLDHMLDQIARHGLVDLEIKAKGDLHIDAHHTVEDIGITLGQAFAKAVGDKKGVRRYGHAYVPLDEALSRVVIDLSGRPGLEMTGKFTRARVGEFDVDLVREFFQGFVNHALVTLHLDNLKGTNTHHQVETLFKAFGRALRMAVELDPRVKGIPSTKGKL